MSDYRRYLRTAEYCRSSPTPNACRDELLFQVCTSRPSYGCGWPRSRPHRRPRMDAKPTSRVRDRCCSARLLALRLLTRQLRMLRRISPRDCHVIRGVLRDKERQLRLAGLRAAPRAARSPTRSPRAAACGTSTVDLYAGAGTIPTSTAWPSCSPDWDRHASPCGAYATSGVVGATVGTGAVGTQATPIALLRRLAIASARSQALREARATSWRRQLRGGTRMNRPRAAAATSGRPSRGCGGPASTLRRIAATRHVPWLLARQLRNRYSRAACAR